MAQDDRSVFQTYQSVDLYNSVVQTYIDSRNKMATDLLVYYFLQTPFGKKYEATAVQPTNDIPFSNIYQTLRAHPDQLSISHQSVVVRIEPVSAEQLNPAYDISVYNVQVDGHGNKYVDGSPVETFVLIPAEAKLVRCPERRVLDTALQTNLLLQFEKAVDLYVAAVRKFEETDGW